MTKQEIKDIIEKIIAEALYILQEMYKNKECNHELGNASCYQIFPEYSTKRHYNDLNKTRESEQEIRFAFVQALLNYNNRKEAEPKLYFSVETPTEKKYAKTADGVKTIKETIRGGGSGNFDLVLHDEKLRRVCLIEFKSDYPGNEKAKDGERFVSIQKDFLRLANPNENKVIADEKEDSLRYFVHTVIQYEKGRVEERLMEAEGIIEKVIVGENKEKPVSVNYVLYSLCRDSKHKEDNEKIKQELTNIIQEKGLNYIKWCPITPIGCHNG